MIKFIKNPFFTQVVQDGRVEQIRIYESGGSAVIIDRRETFYAVFQCAIFRCSASDAVEIVAAILRVDKKRVKALAHNIHGTY